MLIIMCGPPGSGKSTVADLFLEEIDADLIRPSDWMPDNIETLGGELEREYRIQCWRTAIEKTKELVITVSPEELIVLDCANAKYHTIDPTIQKAKRAGHEIVLLYVNTPRSVCKERMADDWVGDETFNGYVDNIKTSLPKYKRTCNKFLVINNHSCQGDLTNSVEAIRDKLCQPT